MAKVVEVKLTGIAQGGEALGRVGKRVTFVKYALPGETVRATITEEHQRWMRGELLQVQQSSPERVTATCPHFGPGLCGGCQWQHISRKAQLDYKRRLVRDQLQRLAGINNAQVRPTVNVGDAWHYRTEMQFHASSQGSLGLRQEQGQGIHPIDHCPLLHPKLDALYTDFNVAWDALRNVSLMIGLHNQDQLVSMRTKRDQVPDIEVDIPVSIVLEKGSGEVLPLIGEPWIFERYRAHSYRLSAGIRVPLSPASAEAIQQTVNAYLQPGPGQVLMDVFCGFGLMTLALAEQVSLVIGIEDDPIAIEDCAFNCGHLDNVVLHEGPPAKVLRKLNDFIDLAVVTPGADGVGHRVAPNLARMGAKRVAYVAYHPATLARDIDQFSQAGFQFQEATPVDVAPQTYYVTTVALFGR